MSRAMIEIDFFGIEKQNQEKALYEKPLDEDQDQRRTFRGIQSAISKIDPHILKTVFANDSFDGRNEETRAWISRQIPPAPPARQPIQLAPFPQATMMPRRSVTETPNEMAKIVTENANEKAPFTIIYNGTVVTFDLSQDKAETILELARNGIVEGHESVKSNFADLPEDGRQLLENLKGDLPIARKQSLQRFLEKRRERLISLSPYSGRSTFEDKKWFMESVGP